MSNSERGTSALRWRCIAGLLALALFAGCFGGQSYPPPGNPMQPGQPMPAFGPQPEVNNPVFIPVQDPNLLWDQLVDVIDDYFKIEREDRVRLVGDILTEGRLDTFPQGSSTIFEPWNKDSVTRYERWEATLQSTRRYASIRVIPAEGGFLVESVVNKELEDVDHPDAVFTGDESLRNDNSIRRFTNNAQGGGRSMGWIPKGRDVALEQEILLQLQARFFAPPGSQPPVYLGENPPAQPMPTANLNPVTGSPPVRQ